MKPIHLQDLSLSIGKTRLLNRVSLHVAEGERVAIVGSNGAGKTTLLRCLLGLISPQTGSITLEGKNLTDLSRREIARMIGYVPQHLNADIPFTVFEFILMSRYAHSMGVIPKDNEGERIAQETIQRIGITHLADQSIATLSGGERQKVNIAAALAQQTPLLILDEPSAHLDPKQQESIQHLLSEIGRESHATMLTVTHDLNWAAMDFDRIIGMKEGAIILDASPEKVMTTENLSAIFDAQWEVYPHPKTGCPMILPNQHTQP